MKIFKQLNKKGYKHYYEGTIEELDSMDKDNQHLHSEIMQVIMWLYEKHNIWIQLTMGKDNTGVWFDWDIFSTITPRKDDLLGEEDVEYENDPNEKWLSYKTTYDSMIDERFALIEKENYPSPTEAYEAAIEHTLNNLI